MECRAVKKGRNIGVFDTWDECRSNVIGFSGAIYKSFPTLEEAKAFVNGNDSADDEIAGEPSSISSKHVDTYAFVDGSFNADTNTYGYGGFLFSNGKKYLIQGADSDPEMAKMRNVAGEICGAIDAVNKAKSLGINEITLYYDYYGIEMWATGGWKTNKIGTTNYANFMKNCGITVHFEHVKGHTGIEGNEMADVLAKQAVGIELTPEQIRLLDKLVDEL